jgi:hypothetical protein
MDMSDGEMEEYEIHTDYSELRKTIGEKAFDRDLTDVIGGPIGWDSNICAPTIETPAATAQLIVSLKRWVFYSLILGFDWRLWN